MHEEIEANAGTEVEFQSQATDVRPTTAKNYRFFSYKLRAQAFGYVDRARLPECAIEASIGPIRLGYDGKMENFLAIFSLHFLFFSVF